MYIFKARIRRIAPAETLPNKVVIYLIIYLASTFVSHLQYEKLIYYEI